MRTDEDCEFIDKNAKLTSNGIKECRGCYAIDDVIRRRRVFVIIYWNYMFPAIVNVVVYDCHCKYRVPSNAFCFSLPFARFMPVAARKTML